MPSRICCLDDHSTKGIPIHEAAVALFIHTLTSIFQRQPTLHRLRLNLPTT